MHDVHTSSDDDDLPIDEPGMPLDEAENAYDDPDAPPEEAATVDSPEAAAAPETSETPRLSSRPKGIRVPYDIDRALQDEMKRRGVKEWSTMVVELVDEALRMRRAPGVVFVDGPVGRRPVIAGTGLDVWEVIATWQEVGREYRRLRAAYEWLTEPQLRAALSYYESYTREIDERLERERKLTPEEAQAAFPFIRSR